MFNQIYITMKKIFTLFALLAMFAFASCEEQGGDNVDPNGKTYLTFVNNTNTTPTMVAGGGMVNITFQTEFDWYITKNVEWLTASKENGEGGTIDFFITADPNPTDQERKGKIIINLSNGKSYDIVVTQEPNDGIQHLVCQDNEILYTTKYNYVIEKDFSGAIGFGDSDATYCVESAYPETYGYLRFNNDVTKIPDNAFDGCASVEVIYLPSGVESVGKNAFKACTALHSIISTNSVDNNRALVIDGCLCAVAPAKLEEYTIPAGVTKIGAGAFSGCKTLQRVIIPEGVVEIEEGAFEDCENLSYLEIPNSLTTFGGDVITGECNEDFSLYVNPDHPNILTYTTSDNQPITLHRYDNVLSEGFDNGVGIVFYFVPEISSNQFYKRETLTSVTIPEVITEIGYGAFRDCTSLADVYCNAITPPTLGSDVFENNANGRFIYVPQDSVADYCAATNWKLYKTHITYIGGAVPPQVGDLVTYGGAKGVVFYVADDVIKIVSVSETSKDWYDAVSWCENYGTGWYLPTNSDLLKIYNNKSTINTTLSANGYTTLGTGYYWSSTESYSGYAYRTGFSSGNCYDSGKSNSYYVRAVLAF